MPQLHPELTSSPASTASPLLQATLTFCFGIPLTPGFRLVSVSTFFLSRRGGSFTPRRQITSHLCSELVSLLCPGSANPHLFLLPPCPLPSSSGSDTQACVVLPPHFDLAVPSAWNTLPLELHASRLTSPDHHVKITAGINPSSGHTHYWSPFFCFALSLSQSLRSNLLISYGDYALSPRSPTRSALRTEVSVFLACSGLHGGTQHLVGAQ